MSTVYEELLEWSETIPVWQRDALRRLIRGSRAEDTDELKHLCLAQFGLGIPGYENVEPNPLSGQHLPSNGTNTSSVTLHSINSVRNVNLLDPESVLNFTVKGLTIIYGDNGSGKSGYTRILKKICRARDAGGKIYPNIFEEPSGQAASAHITYSTAGGGSTTFEWVYQQESPADLSRISIFDSDCADFYVTRYNDIAYRPFGLDLFDRLASIADGIRQELEREIDSAIRICPEPPKELLETDVISSLFPLSSKTKMDEILKAASWTAQSDAELQRIDRFLKEDSPASKAASIRARKGILEELKKRIDAISSALCSKQYDQFEQHLSELATAKEAMRIVSEEAFVGLIPGTGSDPWKQLWSYARVYSEGLAYPSTPFPNLEDDAVCVLCQQPLSIQAKQRLAQFAKYVSEESAKKLEECQQAVSDDQNLIQKLAVKTEGDESIYQELTVHSEELRESVRRLFVEVATVQTQLLTMLRSGNWQSPNTCDFDTSALDTIIDALEKEAKGLDVDCENTSVLEAEKTLLELHAKKWLNANTDQLQKELARLDKVDKINNAIATTKTTGISRKANELTRKYVTQDLQDRIKEELRQINASGLRITLMGKTEKGSMLHRVDIDGKKIGDSEVKDVVSEGEYRAIALAAFFAELGQSPDKSSIVVDDPVCSLDHVHRGRVAARLAQEATARQVIVLTHDLVFLDDLLREASNCGIDYRTCYVLRRQGHVGVVCDGLPWIGQTVKTRISALKQRLGELRLLYVEDADSQDYSRQAQLWYGDLRETWERTVEELVLNSVVIRFSREVQTQRLKRVIERTDEDYDRIEEGMCKSSAWLPGHDQPQAVNARMPPPDELMSDLVKLEDYVKALSKKCQPRNNLLPLEVSTGID